MDRPKRQAPKIQDPNFHFYTSTSPTRKMKKKQNSVQKAEMKKSPETVFYDYKFENINASGVLALETEPTNGKFHTTRPSQWQDAALNYYQCLHQEGVISQPPVFQKSEHGEQLQIQASRNGKNYNLSLYIYDTGTVMIQGRDFKTWEELDFARIKQLVERMITPRHQSFTRRRSQDTSSTVSTQSSDTMADATFETQSSDVMAGKDPADTSVSESTNELRVSETQEAVPIAASTPSSMDRHHSTLITEIESDATIADSQSLSSPPNVDSLLRSTVLVDSLLRSTALGDMVESDTNASQTAQSAHSFVTDDMLPPATVHSSEEQIVQLSIQLVAARDEAQKARSEMKLLRQTVNDLTVQVNVKDQELSVQSTALKEIKRLNTTRTKEISKMTREKDSLKKESIALKANVHGEVQRCRILERELDDMRFERDTLLGKISSIQTKCSEASVLLTAEDDETVADPWPSLAQATAISNTTPASRQKAPATRSRTATVKAGAAPARKVPVPAPRKSKLKQPIHPTYVQRRKLRVTVIGASNTRNLSPSLQSQKLDTCVFVNPGCRLQDLENRTKCMITKTTDIAVLHLGTNDALGNTTDAQCMLQCNIALSKIEDAHKREHSKIPLLVCSVPPTVSREGQRRVDMLNDLLWSRCKKSNVLHFLDTGLSPQHIGRDGVHLTSNGKAELAKAISFGVQDFIKSPRSVCK